MKPKDYCKQYSQTLTALFGKIIEEEWENIDSAADLIADTVASDHLIHVLGSGGHSFMAAEEMFYRTGGLVPVNPIFEQGFSVVNGALRSTLMERIPNYVKPVLDYYRLEKNDILILVNAYGMNCVTIDTALECERRGVKVVGVSSLDFSSKVPKDHPARHPSKKNLSEIQSLAVHIDNKMPYGDGVITFDNLDQVVGPVSTQVNTFILNEMVVASVAKLLERGIKPPVWTSMNTPGGAEKNKDFVEKYFTRIKHL